MDSTLPFRIDCTNSDYRFIQLSLRTAIRCDKTTTTICTETEHKRNFETFTYILHLVYQNSHDAVEQKMNHSQKKKGWVSQGTKFKAAIKTSYGGENY